MKKYLNILWLLLLISCYKSFERNNPLDGKKLPIISTTVISNITASSASSTTTITSDGGAAISNKGVVWSTSAAPTINLSTRTNDGTGSVGNFNSSISALLPNTTYYVRSYATNIVGTTYGPEVVFKTITTFASITTTAISSPLPNSVVSGGNISSDGGKPVTARGVVWNTVAAPTVLLSTKTVDSSGIGSFVSKVQSLLPAKQYFIRAYATNGNGTAYGNEITFTTASTIPTVETTDVLNITSVSATGGGNITTDGGSAITARGVVWGTTSSPMVSLTTKSSDGNGTGSFSSKISPLTNGTTYYVRAYATNVNGTAYGKEFIFKALPSLSNITTNSVSSITASSAVSGGDISDDGGDPISARGIVWSTISRPTVELSSKTTDGTGKGNFTSTANSLVAGKTYYLRAYATNSAGTSYGNEISFTTAANLPTVTTTAISSITANSAISGGNVTSDGGGVVTVRGVVWSTKTEPTVAFSSKTTDGGGTGSFTSSINSLIPGQLYYVRAYATNSAGTAYGAELTLTADGLLPTMSTTSISLLTSTTLSTGGNISYDGGSSITARGVVWGIASAPTVLLSTKTTDGTGTGTFVSSLTNLTPSTTYYLRSYATNNKGTGYGNEIIFTTPANLAVLTTIDISDNTTGNSVSSGGNITSDGGGLVSARGVVWGTTSLPTVQLPSKSTNGSGNGIFTSSLTSLLTNTKYFARAYATNSAGTAYGNEVSFTTINNLPVVTTGNATSVDATSAILNGNVSSAGIGIVLQKGIVWAKTTAPTTSSNLGNLKVGAGTGSIAVGPTGLTPGATYYARAYATNSNGTAYGNEITFVTSIAAPTISTVAISSVTSSSASSGGTSIYDGGAAVIAKGIVWGTSSLPTTALTTKTTDGSGNTAFTSKLTQLNANATYFVRAYVTTSFGTAYGNQISFTTPANPPSLTTVPVTSITSSAAVSGGNIISDGNGNITAKGVVWSTFSEPTISLSTKSTSGVGSASYSSNIVSLVPATTYYVRAYATNSSGTAYGNELKFTTLAVTPSITTTTPSTSTDIFATSAILGGNVTNDGGATVTEKGVVWSKFSNPTIDDAKQAGGSGLGSFSTSVTNLSRGTRYYVRAYALNSMGINYGNEINFTTKP